MSRAHILSGSDGGRSSDHALKREDPVFAHHSQELCFNMLLTCSVYKQKVDPGMRRKHAGCTALPQQSLCVIRTVAMAK